MNFFRKAKLATIWLSIAGLWCTGCASTNVNPSAAQHGVGYADFYCNEQASLSWDVREVTSGGSKKIFSEPTPPDEDILRLTFAPGRHRVRVSFLNHVISDPGEVEIEITERSITPVQARLIPAGSATIKGKSIHGGATYYGRYGRSTKVTMQDSAAFRVELSAQTPVAYIMKEQTPYWRKTPP